MRLTSQRPGKDEKREKKKKMDKRSLCTRNVTRISGKLVIVVVYIHTRTSRNIPREKPRPMTVANPGCNRTNAPCENNKAMASSGRDAQHNAGAINGSQIPTHTRMTLLHGIKEQ